MSTPARSRNPRGEGTRLRGEILSAAVSLVDEADGTAALTLRGVARRAGITAPSIYAHFEDLPALTEELLALSFEHLRRAVAASLDPIPDDDPVAGLVAAALAYVRFGWEHPARYRLMFHAEGYSPNAIEVFALVQGQLETCIAAGLSRSTDPRLDVWILWAGLHGVATLAKPARADRRRLGTLDRPALLRTMVLRLARVES